MSTQTAIPTFFGRGTAIYKEHADLRPIIGRLREYATELSLGRRPAALNLEVVLDQFFDQLLAHFAAEENDGYFGTFVEDHPELSCAVERLMAEHEDMVDAVERLRLLAERPGGARDLGMGLLDLLVQFEGHEHEENHLVQTFLSMS